MTKNWLKKNKIYYDKLIFTNAYKYDKHKICNHYDIDIMIDDSRNNGKNCIDNGIDFLLMNTTNNKESDLKRVYSWSEIYSYIKDYKINVILDTDTYNECDDQFALVYLLKSQNKFNINAITIAPYSHKSVSVKEGQELSYNEVLKINNYVNFDTTNKVFKGSIDYLQNGYKSDSEATNKIIDIALNNNKTYIIAIGALTNIALALLKKSNIKNNIEIIWLGGNELGYKDNLEYNFKGDIEAVKTVLESGVKLTILPCKNVVSDLEITIDALKNNLSDNELNNYLLSRFHNDGYHSIKNKRVIWDIAPVAYLINKKWFKTKHINILAINDDTSYRISKNGNTVTMITKIDSDKIYKDLFDKLERKD